MDPKARLRTAIEDSGLSLKDFSEKIDFNSRTLQHYLSGSRKIGVGILTLISDRMDISSTWILTGKGDRLVSNSVRDVAASIADASNSTDNFTSIPRLSIEAAAGNGAQNGEEKEVGSYAFSQEWLKRRGLTVSQLCLITVRGDSMSPKLNDGDLILVDRSQTNIIDGITYVVRLDNDLLVKYVQRVGKGVIALLSENPIYPPREINITEAPNDLAVIGRVVSSMHNWYN